MKYNKKTIQNICDALLNLSSKTDASKAGGITLETFFTWYKTKPEFKKKIDEVESELSDTLKYKAINSLIKNMDDDPKISMWWLERKFQNEFSLKQQITHDVNLKHLQINVQDEDTMITLNEVIKKQLGEGDGN